MGTERQNFVGINGGPQFKFDEAVSFMITCRDQDEVDYFWGRLTDGGEEGQCGWCKDQFGLSWQVVPRAWRTYSATRQGEGQRAMQAMLQMKKLDIGALRAAAEGEATGDLAFSSGFAQVISRAGLTRSGRSSGSHRASSRISAGPAVTPTMTRNQVEPRSVPCRSSGSGRGARRPPSACGLPPACHPDPCALVAGEAERREAPAADHAEPGEKRLVVRGEGNRDLGRGITDERFAQKGQAVDEERREGRQREGFVQRLGVGQLAAQPPVGLVELLSSPMPTARLASTSAAVPAARLVTQKRPPV